MRLRERHPRRGATTPRAGTLGDECGEVVGEGLGQLVLGPPAGSGPADLRIAVPTQAPSGLRRGVVRVRRGRWQFRQVVAVGSGLLNSLT